MFHAEGIDAAVLKVVNVVEEEGVELTIVAEDVEGVLILLCNDWQTASSEEPAVNSHELK